MRHETILKELRESSRCSLTQKQASILLQVTLASIQNWESGRKRVRTPATLHKMLELYGADDADRLRAIVMMFGADQDQESLKKILIKTGTGRMKDG